MTDNDLTTLQNATATKIQNLLAPLLPTRPPGVDPLPRVTVIDHMDFPVAPLPEPTLASQGLIWLSDSWQTLAMIFVQSSPSSRFARQCSAHQNHATKNLHVALECRWTVH